MAEKAILENAVVLPDLQATTEAGVIREMIENLSVRPELLDAQKFEQAVLERQKLQPPLLGNGVALPHARSGSVSDIVLAIGRCQKSVPFGPEAVPIRLIFLYGVPPHGIAAYLGAVAQLTRFLKTTGSIANLLAAPDEASFRKFLT